ncbi:hypothetical protein F5Y06DRAFT_279382 [Hypoxylon sp. FL0890]|nr:hypothetical protein F5Y06DRAFT_279382 [Hypoxylon sp. FL0890]
MLNLTKTQTQSEITACEVPRWTMEAKGYTRIDRGNVLTTLESRLSETQSPLHGPQVQLFRIRSPPNAVPSCKMPHWAPSKEPQHEEPSKDSHTMRPPEDLIQTYTKRIQVMQAIINQLREAGKERQRSDDDAKKTRDELAKAKLRIAALEDELERGVDEQKATVEQHDAVVVVNEDEHQRGVAEEVDENCAELEKVNESLTERHHYQGGQGHISNDVVRLHHVVWGSQSVHDESLDHRLLHCATQRSSFTATCDFVGRDVEPGERRTLVIAYSRAPDGPMRWLVIDEGREGKFDL